jgi:hypothetical protein
MCILEIVMKKGLRTVHRLCACGCGNEVPPTINSKTGRVKRYPKFIPKHGNADWGKRWAQRLETEGHPCSKPIGSLQPRKDGYIKIKTNNGWKYEHRVITNAAPDEIAHHENNNPSDNSPTNLIKMSSAEHTRLHLSLPIGAWSRGYSSCVSCGTTSRAYYGRGLCSRCGQRENAARKGFWP